MAKPSIKSRAANVRLLLFDVDGVLTDGTVEMHADGSESKGFHVRDGAAIVWARHAGLTTARRRPPPRARRSSRSALSRRQGARSWTPTARSCESTG
jgi:3-deoxy-D-manno-octulosonate 8-phosphate phosphatase (KDO 8-P phosphatase)